MMQHVTLTCTKPPQCYKGHLFCAYIKMYASSTVCIPTIKCNDSSTLSGHPILMQVWVTMFARLLKDPLIPAIVVPEGYPNESTWRLLRQSVPAEVTGSILTCQHDISAEWRTYYDYRWVTMVTELIQKLDS